MTANLPQVLTVLVVGFTLGILLGVWMAGKGP